ncbi:MAG: transglycosylase domain-containing protein [Spirochaetes bacterium]|nr:transglycosylase domain-containing protein [Spirochaetota bacterium]
MNSEEPKARLSLKRVLLLSLKAIVIVHIVYIVLTSVFIFSYKFVNPPFTILMPYRAIGYGWKLQKPIPLPLKKVPAYIKWMLISVEDGNFYQHHGIEMEAFKRAREINAKVGKPLYGGSTLTMQVARTLFLVPEKSYVRKYFEVITALELELFLSKDRILELYFGYAEWGKGIFGMEAAARNYYKTSVSSLDRDQAARLIALLSSPIKYNPATLSKSGILRERYSYLVRRFVAPAIEPPDGPIDEAPPPSVEPGVDLPEEVQAANQASPAADQASPAADQESPAADQESPAADQESQTAQSP